MSSTDPSNESDPAHIEEWHVTVIPKYHPMSPSSSSTPAHHDTRRSIGDLPSGDHLASWCHSRSCDVAHEPLGQVARVAHHIDLLTVPDLTEWIGYPTPRDGVWR